MFTFNFFCGFMTAFLLCAAVWVWTRPCRLNERVELRYNGYNPRGLYARIQAEAMTGEAGDYSEVRVLVCNKETRILADILIGMSNPDEADRDPRDEFGFAGEIRILSSADGDPDDHRVAVFPERAVSEGVTDNNWA